MNRVRPPAVDGMFYPGKRNELLSMVDEMLAAAKPAPPVPVALLVPHAGYVYSGSIAALGYAQWRGAQIDHVVIVGPTHRVGVRAVALPDAEVMGTPLGQVRVWAAGVDLIRGLPQVTASAAVHAEEHSIEVQLPFIQRVLPDADVLPLAAGWVTAEEAAEVLEALWGQPGLGIVISSDLSHYHTYDEACALDGATIVDVLTLDPGINHDQACGATGLDAMLLVAARHNLKPRLLGACNSGDTAGDRRRVVGYCCVAFDSPDAGA